MQIWGEKCQDVCIYNPVTSSDRKVFMYGNTDFRVWQKDVNNIIVKRYVHVSNDIKIPGDTIFDHFGVRVSTRKQHFAQTGEDLRSKDYTPSVYFDPELEEVRYWEGALTLPHWVVFPFCCVLPIIWTRRVFRNRKRLGRIRHGQCPICGYDLRASRERCPECGETIVIEIPKQLG